MVTVSKTTGHLLWLLQYRPWLCYYYVLLEEGARKNFKIIKLIEK